MLYPSNRGDSRDMDRLEHIHASLAQALVRSRGGEAFGNPVTVAEIYQDLVPYRAVRTQLGFDMNADYEHTLLRLLAGEGDLARLDPPEAREELQDELGAPNPNVGLFRKFAGCDVWIAKPPPGAPIVDAPEPARASSLGREGDAWENRSALWMDPTAVQDETPEAPPTAAALTPDPDDAEAAVEDDGFELLLDDAIEVIDPAEAGPGEPDPVLASGSAEPEAAGDPPAPPAPPKSEDSRLSTSATVAGDTSAEATNSSACAFCDTALPSGRKARFCPFCGADQALVPCGACDEPLDPSWRFCIACGTDAKSGGT